MKDRTRLLIFIIVFLILYFVPLGGTRIQGAILEAFFMIQEYAREHVLFCLIPAFFIAGAISNFVSKEAVIKYFGAKANKILAYGIASVSGTILAVCSCTVLPMFAGIYTRGAGIGPAVAFLYSGPAINVLAIIL
ncbi:MAG: permease, partial [candidate division WOR-3 bacterium]